MTSVHRYSLMMSVRGDEGFVGYTGGDADVKTQLDEIIKTKLSATGCNLLCQSCIALIATHYRIV